MLQVLWLLPTIFWMWMIYDCIRNDPEKNTWIWILIFLNVPGAIIYFEIRTRLQIWGRFSDLWKNTYGSAKARCG